jgi:microcompartment protein CcmL/EutN
MQALGLVETRGLLAAIEGADAMLKAAEVRLLEKNLVGGGLVTITIAGEVSAVTASVDAAAAAIKRLSASGGALLVSRHVIARPDEGLHGILALKPQESGKSSDPALRYAPSSTAVLTASVKAEAQAQAPPAPGKKEEPAMFVKETAAKPAVQAAVPAPKKNAGADKKATGKKK